MSGFLPEEQAREYWGDSGSKNGAYAEHEMACNIAEDLDNGAIYPWRLDQVKAHLAAGGTTDLNEHGELILVCKHRETREAWVAPQEHPSHYRCVACGDYFPTIGDTDQWKPKEVTLS